MSSSKNKMRFPWIEVLFCCITPISQSMFIIWCDLDIHIHEVQLYTPYHGSLDSDLVAAKYCLIPSFVIALSALGLKSCNSNTKPIDLNDDAENKMTNPTGHQNRHPEHTI